MKETENKENIKRLWDMIGAFNEEAVRQEDLEDEDEVISESNLQEKGS